MASMPQNLRIEWTTRAVRDMRRLNPQDRERIIGRIERYASDPAAFARQVISLTGSPFRRIRVGNYRVIFRIEREAVAIMLVLRVRHRREAYD